jgi:flagellar biosynthesis anti-sigma factor FlgM
MKIENVDNNGISPLSSKKTEGAYRAQANNSVQAADEKRDKAVVSEQARLLAKARTEMEKTSEVENPRVAEIRKQIDSGDYTIQVEKIAQRLLGGIFSKQ